MKAKINVILRTLSPLHVAAPGNLRMDLSTGNISYNQNVGISCTGVQRMPILLDAEEGERSSKNIPVVAANNIAGRLRRHAAELVLNAVTAKGEAVSLQTFSLLNSGAVTGNPSDEDLSYAEYKEARQHPYFGLLGGGPKMIRRSLRVSPLVPMVVDAARVGMLQHPNALDHVTDAKRIEGVWAFRRNDDLRDLAKVELMESSIGDFEAVYEERQQMVFKEQEEARRKREKQKNGETANSSDKAQVKSSTFTYSAVEFVYPNVPFELTFELDVDGPAQLGLFLAALDSFASKERLGGHSRNGFGRFILEDAKFTQEDDFAMESEPVDIFNDGRLNRDVEVVSEALAAWEDSKAGLDAESLDAFAQSSRKAKKAAK